MGEGPACACGPCRATTDPGVLAGVPETRIFGRAGDPSGLDAGTAVQACPRQHERTAIVLRRALLDQRPKVVAPVPDTTRRTSCA